MANTDKLGMTLIQGSDVVDYNTLNNNFQILDKLGVDYVIENGTKGEWWYRKWNSGRAECGVDARNFGNVGFEGWTYQGFHITTLVTFGNYPFTFSTVPNTIVTFKSPDSGTPGFIIFAHANSDAYTHPSFRYATPSETNSLTNAIFGTYVTGRWR